MTKAVARPALPRLHKAMCGLQHRIVWEVVSNEALGCAPLLRTLSRASRAFALAGVVALLSLPVAAEPGVAIAWQTACSSESCGQVPAQTRSLVAQLPATLPATSRKDEGDPRLSAPRTPLPPESAVSAGSDDFVGPFPSWRDLKRDYGGKGDGISDDTDAVQAALDDLRASAGKSPVLFIPTGVYLLKRTVAVTAAQSISIIGEDPRTTVLKWAGSSFTFPATTSMFHVDGVSYSRFDRLTFDGNGAGVVLVDQSVQDYTNGRQFDTGNEYADDIFQNGLIGIQGGQYGLGAAETTVLRSKFLHNAWGILLKNFNALDWWIWYSYFEDNGTSISNIPGAGNFHAFNSIFKQSRFADLALLNTGNFNFRDNFSSGSRRFLYEQFYYTNAAVTRLQHNTVITPEGNDCNGCSVDMGNMGPIVLTDNIFVGPPDSPAAVLVKSLNPPDCISVGNTATSARVTQCGGDNSGRMISVDESQVDRRTTNLSPPRLPDLPRKQERSIFEVAAGASAAILQKAIDQAAALCGARPVVHLPFGVYQFDRTIVLPPNCDLQLIGDGAQTRLLWVGADGGTVLRLSGPSHAILRDFRIDAGSGVGIDIENADQPGSRVYMQQTSALRSLNEAILVDRLDYTAVELHDFQIAYTAVSPASTGIGLKVVGGPLAQQGKPQSGRTILLAGSGATNHLSYSVSQGGNLIVRDAWYESNSSSDFAEVSDDSKLTIEGTRISNSGGAGGLAVPTTAEAVRLNGTSCNAVLLASAPDSQFRISEGTKGSAWVAGNNFGTASAYFTNASGAQAAFNLNRRYSKTDGSLAAADETGRPDDEFVRRMLAQSRSTHPSEIVDLPNEITDVRLFRIWVELGRTAIYLHR